MAVKAKVIADSISPEGVRLTTLECTFHRFILAEFNTHRAFSRNSSSSRAIPTNKTMNQVITNPALPLVYPREQPGMSGGEIIEMSASAEEIWMAAGDAAVGFANQLVELGVHKSVANRLLEPYMWHTVVVTATDYDNFFVQRMQNSAQPEMVSLAYRMHEALLASTPTAVDWGGWHLPYIQDDEQELYEPEICRQLSVARVAGVSYARVGEVRMIEKDLALYDRLRSASPPHWSPFEHVATPAELVMPNAVMGNFYGWQQLRHLVGKSSMKNNPR